MLSRGLGNAEDAGDRACDQSFIVGLVSCQGDDRTFNGTNEGQRDSPGRWAVRDGTTISSGVDQLDTAAYEGFRVFGQFLSQLMILPAELHPQCPRHARDVTAAKDGVPAGQCQQGLGRIGLLGDQLAHFIAPGSVDPTKCLEGQRFFVFELVVQRAAGIARLTGDLLQVQVGVAMARQPSSRSLEECGSTALPTSCLGSLRGFGGTCHTCMHVCNLATSRWLVTEGNRRATAQ